MKGKLLLDTSLIFIFLSAFSKADAQNISKGSALVSFTAGFFKPTTPNYFKGFYPNEDYYNNTPFMLNGQVGGFVCSKTYVAIEANMTNYKQEVNRPTNLTGGPLNQSDRMIGVAIDRTFSIGLAFGRYFQIKKNFFIVANLYSHYLQNTSYEEGGIYTSNGEYAGVSYTTYTGNENGNDYGMRIGVNLNLNYFLNENLACTLRFGQLDIQFRKLRYNPQSYLEAPLMLGVSYHLGQ